MKTKTITLPHCELLVVEMPEEAINVYIHQEFIQYESFGIHKFRLPDGNWQLIGRLPEITRVDWRRIVELENIKPVYKGLRYHTELEYTDCNGGKFSCPTDAGLSLLQANEVYFESPIEYPSYHDPKYYDEPYDGTGFYQEIYSIDLAQWREAQSKVWDKERCYLFIKVD